MLINYLRTDFYRLVKSSQFYISVVGIFAVYMISSLQTIGMRNVIEIFWMVKFYSFTICIFAAGSFAFSNGLLEDIEHKFCYNCVLRGNLKDYVMAKVICCFVAAMLATMLGTTIYAVVLHFRLPFLASADDMTMINIIRQHDIFGCFIVEHGFFLYFLCSGIMIGLLAGILSLVSMWLSLIAKNRMFAICFPVFGYYFSVNYLADLLGNDCVLLDINGIYLYSCYVFENAPVYSFVYAVCLALTAGILLKCLIYRRIRRIWRVL